ncbi:MAG TPA: Rrf2 family transcriptional regulator [Candidatus Cloacimonetes bacterium]|nr:Rrf2 family transcriptional regulator [Candidatus Cloacimonadota bacterium]HEX37696.1 Rrf2 family transcriptional regulator [Candidatus Cloacimonadota bacterium]
MKISIDTDYSLRALQELAKQDRSVPYSVFKIAQKRNIPNKYLEKLFRRLKQAGIVNAIKGRKGGYKMAREPEKITVKDIIAAVDGRTHIHNCEERKNQKLCEFIDQCTFQDFWNDFNTHIDNFLDTYTLADFLKK